MDQSVQPRTARMLRWTHSEIAAFSVPPRKPHSAVWNGFLHRGTVREDTKKQKKKYPLGHDFLATRFVISIPETQQHARNVLNVLNPRKDQLLCSPLPTFSREPVRQKKKMNCKCFFSTSTWSSSPITTNGYEYVVLQDMHRFRGLESTKFNKHDQSKKAQ